MKKTDFMTMTAAMMLATSACVGPEKNRTDRWPHHRQAGDYSKRRPYDP